MGNSFRFTAAAVTAVALAAGMTWVASAGAATSPPSTVPAAGVPMAHIKSRVAMRVFRGVVVSVDTARDRLVVSLRRGRRGTRTAHSEVEFLVAGARMRVGDRNGDGDRDLGDIRRGDRISLKTLASRGAASAREPLEARVVTNQSSLRGPSGVGQGRSGSHGA